MDQTRSKTDKSLKGDLGWFAADKFYELLQELQLDMLDCRKNNDINGMIETFSDICIHVYPYIFKYMVTDEEKEVDDMSQIEQLLSSSKRGDTDHAQRYNGSLMGQSKSIINNKRKILAMLMAKAGLCIPVFKREDERPAALATDDY